ncbi:Disease resistance-like protein DSC1 [Citrus sinensis]|nr:Disease resistance-like protein DSC1 [Citrus sinensis]
MKFLKKGESKSEESSRQESHIFHLLSVSFTKFASSMASSSSLTVQSKYEVFLSFRGEDTRNGFTSHLAAALHRKQIQFFIDDEELKKGDEISPAISNAIETSDISIIIFSKDYASSKWCLNELVKILDCKKMNGQIVIPVFYQVDPSDVRNQRGTFKKAFVHHENNFPDKVQKWRDVLTEASNFSGYDSTESRKEAELVEKIAEDISKKLEDMYDTTDSDGFIGLNSRIEEMKSLLRLESHDVRIVGIWGMGGIGKTTIASVVFHQISRDFQGKCFMANVREQSNKMGVIHVRDEVISQVLGENLKIGTLTIPQNVRKRLWRMKVLIVLDDVHDEFTQLESLANGVGGFSPGSRIIITTRDKRVLDKCGVNSVYEVEQLTYNHALELFCRKAFRQNNRSRDLLELSQEVVCYADGNPLALEVLGSSLYHKSKQQWKDKLNNLKLISEPSIYKVLKISYDELNSEVKEIFIDIACFFKGEDIDFMTRIHDDPMSIHDGLNILVNKSLITISDENELQMHDLLQEMGQTIVRQESAREPGKRSRLWDHNDVCYVLKKNKGTDKVEGIFLDLSKINDIHLNPQAFANMSNLRLLKFYMPKHNDIPIMSSKLHLDQGLEYLPEELRYLHWHEYSLKMLPFDFEPENLIELNLPYSKVEQIWKGEKVWLDLRGCGLTAIPQEIGCLSSLKELDICENNFESLPASIMQLSRLTYLYLSKCNMLLSLPELSLSLKWLDASNCKRLQSLPEIPSSLEEVDASFWFTNSMKLDDKANNKNLADSQLRIQHMAIASLRLFSELAEPCILKGPIIVLPGSEIPEWFSNQSSGSQITLQLPQHCCQNLAGFALCAVLERSDSEWAEFDVGCRYSFEMKTLSGRKHVRRCCVMASYQITKTDHVMLGFRPCGNVGFPDDNLHTTVSFNFFSNSDTAVTCCGVCAVNANPNENKPNTFTLNFATESWKLDDMASASGTSDEEELEPSPKRICRDQINSP